MRAILWLGLFAVSLALSGCGDNTTTRYRLAAEVETPQGIASGSSVIEVKWHRPGALAKQILGSQASGSYSIRGEAVAVELPNNQVLFVLLRSQNDVDWAAWVLGQIGDGKPVPVPRRWKYGPGPPGEMVDNYPLFVRFKDIDDPMSVETVDPDDLSATFGQGHSLKSLTFQRTNSDVNFRIERRIRWINEMENHNYKSDGSLREKYPTLLLGLRKK